MYVQLRIMVLKNRNEFILPRSIRLYGIECLTHQHVFVCRGCPMKFNPTELYFTLMRPETGNVYLSF